MVLENQIPSQNSSFFKSKLFVGIIIFAVIAVLAFFIFGRLLNSTNSSKTAVLPYQNNSASNSLAESNEADCLSNDCLEGTPHKIKDSSECVLSFNPAGCYQDYAKDTGDVSVCDKIVTLAIPGVDEIYKPLVVVNCYYGAALENYNKNPLICKLLRNSVLNFTSEDVYSCYLHVSDNLGLNQTEVCASNFNDSSEVNACTEIELSKFS